MRIRDACNLHFCSPYFSEQNGIFLNFFLHFLVFFILERRQLNFYRFKTFKNMEKIEKMLLSQKFLQIRNRDGLIDLFHLLNWRNSTSRKSRKLQRLIVLLNIFGFDRKIFVLRFWIFHVFWVNRTSWNRISQYFCRPRICSIFFEFLKMSKSHKDHYRVTGQAKSDLIVI